jgi:DNA repair exonuclease SbcCD ATPase subunit
MLLLKTLRFKNILSFGNQFTEIQLDRSPSTLVTGQSGAGKSTIIESLTFVLFGKPFRKIQKKTLCNSVNGKDCLVELEFEANNVSYKIRRGLKPDIFEIYANDELLNQDPSVRDYQKYLDEHILKMNYRTFTQVIVLGYANHTPFMLLSAYDRRLMVDELLDTFIFARMYKKLLGRNTEHKNETTIVDNDISNFKSSIEVLVSNLNKLKSKEKSQEDAILHEIDKIQETISNLEVEVVQLQTEVESLFLKTESHDVYQKKFQELSTIRSKFEINLEKITKELKFFETSTSCPICEQGISHDHKDLMIDARSEQQEKIVLGITKAEETSNKIKDKLDEFQAILRTINSKEKEISSSTSAISTYQKVVASKQKELTLLTTGDSVSKDTEEKIAELKNSLSESIDVKKDLIAQKHYYDAAGSLLKDEGIKARIIREYIPIINSLVNEYLDAMNFHFRFELDETFEEKILSRFRDELKYQNLSQGEQARLSLALTLSWRKLAELRNSVNCNLLFLDEITDDAISAADMESVWGLIEEMTKDNNVFIISHKPDIIYDKVHSQITIIKDGNFSKMETK